MNTSENILVPYVERPAYLVSTSIIFVELKRTKSLDCRETVGVPLESEQKYKSASFSVRIVIELLMLSRNG